MLNNAKTVSSAYLYIYTAIKFQFDKEYMKIFGLGWDFLRRKKCILRMASHLDKIKYNKLTVCKMPFSSLQLLI